MEEAERFARDGFVVMDRVFDPAFVEELRTEYLRQFPDVGGSPERYPVGNRRLQVPVRMSGPYLSTEFYANPTLIQLASAALGDDHVIESVAVVTALPGAKPQHIHTDHEDLYPGQAFTRAVIGAYAITVAIPMVDLTEETGTTKLFTRSHLKPRGEDFELPYIERGRCFAMDYRLSHQGTENRSPAERPMVYLVYARRWFIDTHNYGNDTRIRIANEDLAAVPEAHRSLFRRLKSGPDEIDAKAAG